jgi:8-oxo-dGTP pyrophosphatase MutT (NUDIX family)
VHVIPLDRIRVSLSSHRPRLIDPYGKGQAAVAMVLRDASSGPELLLIERAKRAGDPWSGHMAFPGGRVERLDPNPRFAAERETLEEVGLRLGEAEILGRLDDLGGRHAGRTAELVISGFAYFAPEPAPIVSSPEVREALWVPLSILLDPARHVDYAYPPAPGATYPGILVGDPERHVVWGLTYRFLEGFFGIVGHPLPPRPEALR